MTAAKRCPRCGQDKPTGEFYRHQRTRLSAYCRACQRGHRHLGGQNPSGGDAA